MLKCLYNWPIILLLIPNVPGKVSTDVEVENIFYGTEVKKVFPVYHPLPTSIFHKDLTFIRLFNTQSCQPYRLTSKISVGGTPPAESPHLPWMRLRLPRHDLLGEERWPISQRRRALSLFFSGLLLGSICTGIQVKLINQTIDNIQRTVRAYSEWGSVS